MYEGRGKRFFFLDLFHGWTIVSAGDCGICVVHRWRIRCSWVCMCCQSMAFSSLFLFSFFLREREREREEVAHAQNRFRSIHLNIGFAALGERGRSKKVLS